MRYLTMLAALCISVAALVSPVYGQPYPSRPIKIIVPHPAGGSADQLVRLIAAKMGEGLNTVFVIDNRGGANGLIGLEAAAKAPPDGYTLVMGGTSSMPMNAAIYPKLPFDPIKDFAPISCFSYSPLVLVVNPAVPANTVEEFIALAKKQPGQVSYASFGIGSTSHFAGELFGTMTGTKLLHVPYKGSSQSTVDLLSGLVMSGFDTMQNATPYIRTKRFRALGIASLKRSPAAPEIPTIAESGVPGFEIGSTFGLLAPANTPREIITKLHDEMARVLALPDVVASMRSVGTEPFSNTPEQYAELIRTEMIKWAKVARDANVQAE